MKTILLAEDFADDADLLKLALKEGGIHNHVVTVGNGEDVIAYLKGEGQFGDRASFPFPNALFLDLKMPRISGLQVLERIRDQPQYKSLLVVVLSGLAELKDVQAAYQTGAHTFLRKPVHPQDIRTLAHAFSGYWLKNPA